MTNMKAWRVHQWQLTSWTIADWATEHETPLTTCSFIETGSVQKLISGYRFSIRKFLPARVTHCVQRLVPPPHQYWQQNNNWDLCMILRHFTECGRSRVPILADLLLLFFTNYVFYAAKHITPECDAIWCVQIGEAGTSELTVSVWMQTYT